MPEQIIIVGNKGVGKSTVAVNLAAALADDGHRVAMIGYGKKRNSTAPLASGKKLRPAETCVDLQYTLGYKGSLCIEAGESNRDASVLPTAISALLMDHAPAYVVHDHHEHLETPSVMPDKRDIPPTLLTVCSGDMVSMQAVNNLFKWLNNNASSDCRFAGIIINNTSNRIFESMVNDFASRTGATVRENLHYSIMHSISEYLGKTLVESAPQSHNSLLFRHLARSIITGTVVPRPSFFDETELAHWGEKWYEVITRMESGMVMDGSGI